MKKKKTKCLNCGTLCNDKFCPHCGQATNVGRIDATIFFKTAAANFSRISESYFVTAYELVIHPWTVVKEYVYGKRVKYVAPVAMLLLTALYTSIIFSFMDYDDPQLHTDSQNLFVRIVTETIDSSVALQFILFAPIVAGTTYVAYFRSVKPRFNYFEICIATFFYLSTLLLYNLLFIPLTFIDSDLCDSLTIIAVIILGMAGLTKAFPQPTVFKTIRKLASWALLNLICLTAYWACIDNLLSLKM